MPLPAFLAGLLGNIGKGAMTAVKTLPSVGNSIGKGLVTGSKYAGQIADNLSPFAKILSGYSGTSGQIPSTQNISSIPIMSQNMQTPYINSSQNPFSSSALAKQLRGYFNG